MRDPVCRRGSTPGPSSSFGDCGVEVVSSGDLVQRFSAVWTRRAKIATHMAASEKLYRIKDRAFEAVARRLRDGVADSEYDIQQLMARLVPGRRAGHRLGAGRVGG